MKRKIIKIDEDRCNGCGLCAKACHEGAIGMVDGKARLLRENYCDGLGDCLPVCPVNAISFEEREAPVYDEAAVKANQKRLSTVSLSGHGGNDGQIAAHNGHGGNDGQIAAHNGHGGVLPCGCPGSNAKAIGRNKVSENIAAPAPQAQISELRQWPVQIKLVPVNAPYFKGANLLIAADCAAYAYANFHADFIKNHITIIGCPKLDMTEYEHKLTEIIASNDIKSVKIVRMEVPCCGGIEHSAKTALQKSGKFIPWSVHTITTDGRIL